MLQKESTILLGYLAQTAPNRVLEVQQKAEQLKTELIEKFKTISKDEDKLIEFVAFGLFIADIENTCKELGLDIL